MNNLAPILFVIFQDKFDISYEMIGRLILLNFGTQIISDLLSARYVDRIGYRKAAAIAHILCTGGLICLGVLPNLLHSPYIGLSIAVVIYAVGGGIIEVIISPIVDSLPGDTKASAMSLLHSFYCWGQMGVVLFSTILIKLIGADIWFTLPIVWSLIPLNNLYRFLRVPLMPMVSESERTPIQHLLSSKAFIIALALMLSAGASELVISQWSSLFAEQGLGVTKLAGDLLGPGLFAVLMGLGRTFYGFWGQTLPINKALAASSILCIVCYLIAVFAKTPVYSLMGCALCGLSVSLMWPGTFSMTAESFPKGGTLMFGLLAIFGDLGASVGPWSAGFISDLSQSSDLFLTYAAKAGLSAEHAGLRAGLFAGIIFPIIMLLGIISLKRHKLPVTCK